MTGKQHAVMWMGLLLILMRMFTTTQWGDIKNALGVGGNFSSGGGGSSDSPLAGKNVANAAKDVVDPQGQKGKAETSQPLWQQALLQLDPLHWL
jgi:hypothetical protein